MAKVLCVLYDDPVGGIRARTTAMRSRAGAAALPLLGVWVFSLYGSASLGVSWTLPDAHT